MTETTKAPTVLTRANFLQPAPRRVVTVPLPEMNGVAHVRSLTERERSAYESTFLDDDGKADRGSVEAARRKLIVACLSDESGNPLLGAADEDAVGNLDAAIAGRIYSAARDLAGFNETDIKELVGNSSAPLAGGSPSA